MLRTLGLNASDARQQRIQFAANPFGIVTVPADFNGTLRQISLRSGQALLIENVGDYRKCAVCPAVGQILVQWNTPEREFMMYGAGISQERMIEIANSLQ
jgi:hypothetical protein